MKNILSNSSPFMINELTGISSEHVKTRLAEIIAKNDGRLIITGTVQRADTVNQNGRIYPWELLNREMLKYKSIEISEKRAYGELDHPDSSIISYKNASHVVLDLWWEDKDLKAKIEILNTPAGNIVKEIMMAGYTIGISSRGQGNVRQLTEDTSQVEDDYELLCWDFVTNPSTHKAYMSTVTESVNKNESIKNTQNYLIINELIRNIICDLNGHCSL